MRILRDKTIIINLETVRFVRIFEKALTIHFDEGETHRIFGPYLDLLKGKLEWALQTSEDYIEVDVVDLIAQFKEITEGQIEFEKKMGLSKIDPLK